MGYLLSFSALKEHSLPSVGAQEMTGRGVEHQSLYIIVEGGISLLFLVEREIMLL